MSGFVSMGHNFSRTVSIGIWFGVILSPSSRSCVPLWWRIGIYAPCVSSIANDMPTILSDIWFRPVVSVSIANILSTRPRYCSSADIVVIVSHLISRFFAGAGAGDASGTSHALPGNENSVAAGEFCSTGNSFSIFAISELLSTFVRINSSAPGVLNRNGMIVNPDKSTSVFNVTSCLEMYAISRLSPRMRSFWTASRFAYRLSRLPNWLISSAAFFGPMPGTPGTLSDESPIRDWTSITWCGLTPNFSRTASVRISRFFMPSYKKTQSDTSCIKSLSLVIIRVAFVVVQFWRARVAITSSASTPGTHKTGIPNDIRPDWIIWPWAIKSAGVAVRFILYSGYISWRNVMRDASNTHINASSGLAVANMGKIILKNPYTAPVGVPSARVRRLCTP